ncbi:MAG: hypothetical protein AAF611_04830 [Bacteroidota bacterium]
MIKSITNLRIFLIFSLLIAITFSCSSDDDSPAPVDPLSLLAKITDQDVSNLRIPAYGYSDDVDSGLVVLILYYLEPNAADIELYKTENLTVDRNDYNNYREFDAELRQLLGTCGQGQVASDGSEYFVIVKYTVDDKIRLSRPIKVNHIENPTVWTSEGITVSQTQPGLPFFFWDRDVVGQSSKFFMAINDFNQTFSVIVTEATNFQFYDPTNVLENFTLNPPVSLPGNQTYTINFLDINEENWSTRAILNFFNEN